LSISLILCVKVTWYLKFNFLTGWSVTDNQTVPVHWLAGTRCTQVWGRLYWFYWTSPQDKGTVWSGRTYLCSLQVIANS